MPLDVYVSVGRTSNSAQEEFVRAVEGSLRELDLRPRTLGRNDWSATQPMIAIRDRMQKCSGAVVIAFERLYVIEGVDRRGSDQEEELRSQSLPTTWNQIEAAMAYTLGLPLLVIVEDGLRSEGLLEARYDWAVQRLPLRPDALRTEQSLGIIADWKDHVVSFNSQHQVQAPLKSELQDLEGKTIGQIIGDLRPGQFRTLVVGVAGTLVAIAGTAFGLGARFG